MEFALRHAVAIISVVKKLRQRKKAAERSSLEEKQNNFLQSFDSDIKKLVTNAVTENTKK